MNKNPESGNVPRRMTIDSKGNIVPKPYGASRWANPAKRPCMHKDCEGHAMILSAGCPGIGKAHNCCSLHKLDKG